MRHQVSFDLTIPNNSADSNVYVLPRAAEALVDFVIYTPATLTGTVKLLLGATQSTSISDLNPMYQGGADVTLTAGKAIPISVAGFRSIAVQSDGNEGADRVFKVVAQMDIDI